MMSSCCTLRLKRRSAFSRDSPSCSLTSAKRTHPQTRPVGLDSYCKVLTLSQVGQGNLTYGKCGRETERIVNWLKLRRFASAHGPDTKKTGVAITNRGRANWELRTENS